MEKFSFLQDDNGHYSSHRLVAVVSGLGMGLGATAVLLAKAWDVYQHGGDCASAILAAAGPVCTLAGVNYAIAKTRTPATAPDESASS
jgi:hypothetical protein